MNTWPTGTLAFFPVLWKQNSGKFFPMLASLETARVCNYHWYVTFMLFLAVYIFFFLMRHMIPLFAITVTLFHSDLLQEKKKRFFADWCM